MHKPRIMTSFLKCSKYCCKSPKTSIFNHRRILPCVYHKTNCCMCIYWKVLYANSLGPGKFMIGGVFKCLQTVNVYKIPRANPGGFRLIIIFKTSTLFTRLFSCLKNRLDRSLIPPLNTFSQPEVLSGRLYPGLQWEVVQFIYLL